MADEKRKWYQDDKGNISSLRLIVVPSAILGQLVVISGVVAMFMGFPDGVAIAGIGAGLVGLAEGAKAWQKMGEKP